MIWMHSHARIFILQRLGQAIHLRNPQFFHKLSVDGSEEDKIHCFKEGQPCSDGRAMLRSRLDILKEPETNSFQSSNDSEVEKACPPTEELLDSNQEGDSKIEID